MPLLKIYFYYYWTRSTKLSSSTVSENFAADQTCVKKPREIIRNSKFPVPTIESNPKRTLVKRRHILGSVCFTDTIRLWSSTNPTHYKIKCKILDQRS